MKNGDGIAIGNRYDFVWPREAGGRYGEEKDEKDGTETTHAGLPWLVVVLRCLPHRNQESNPGKIT
jgi:hypothetical protein